MTDLNGGETDYLFEDTTDDDISAFYEEVQARKRGETGECIASPVNEEEEPDEQL